MDSLEETGRQGDLDVGIQGYAACGERRRPRDQGDRQALHARTARLRAPRGAQGIVCSRRQSLASFRAAPAGRPTSTGDRYQFQTKLSLVIFWDLREASLHTSLPERSTPTLLPAHRLVMPGAEPVGPPLRISARSAPWAALSCRQW